MSDVNSTEGVKGRPQRQRLLVGAAKVLVMAVIVWFAWQNAPGGLTAGSCVTNPGRGFESTVKVLNCDLEGATHKLVPASEGCAVRIPDKDLCVVARSD